MQDGIAKFSASWNLPKFQPNWKSKCGSKKFLVKDIFGKKKILAEKFSGTNKFKSQKEFFGKKRNEGPKVLLVQRMDWDQNFGSKDLVK